MASRPWEVIADPLSWPARPCPSSTGPEGGCRWLHPAAAHLTVRPAAPTLAGPEARARLR
jgi:hypothetical protein